MRVNDCCQKRQSSWHISLHIRSSLAPNLIIFAPTQFQPLPRNQRARRRWRGPPWSLKLRPRSLTLKWNGSATQRTLSRAADTRSPLTATGTRCPSETSPRKTRTPMPWLPGGQRSSSTWKSYQSQVGDFDAAAARWKSRCSLTCTVGHKVRGKTAEMHNKSHRGCKRSMHSNSHHATASLLHGNTSLHMHCWKNLEGTIDEKKLNCVELTNGAVSKNPVCPTQQGLFLFTCTSPITYFGAIHPAA